MISKKAFLVATTLILLNGGCREKDDLTLPVKVYLEIGLSQESSPVTSYLDFTNGMIVLSRLHFEGTREAGGNIYFETNYRKSEQEIKFNQNPAIISEYDIPQGIYNYMKWDIFMECPDGDYTDRIEPNLCDAFNISGSYTYLNNSVIPLIFHYEIDWVGAGFIVRCENPDGASRIVLSVNKEYLAIVLFDPANAFSTISRKSLEEAEVSEVDGSPAIVISAGKNKELYEILSYRIFQSAKTIVK